MHLRSKSYFRFSVLLLTSAALFFALPAPPLAAQDLKTVLSKLDAAAANFHSTSADFRVRLL